MKTQNAIEQATKTGSLLKKSPACHSEWSEEPAFRQHRPLCWQSSPRRSRLLISALCFFCASAAHAGTITVNSTAQRSGSTTAVCTIGAAIVAANTNAIVDGCTGATAAPNTIMVPAGTYTLTMVDSIGGFGVPIGLPGISSDIIIQGAAAATTIIVRSSALGTPPFAFFDVSQNTGTLTVNDVTLRNGNAGTSSGGAIFATGVASATCASGLCVNRCVFDSNTAAAGGAIDTFGGPLTVSGSTFTNNTTKGGLNGGNGGAIDGAAAVTNSTFMNNSTSPTRTDDGGAISGNPCTVTDSTFVNNTTGRNGGALNCNSGTVVRSVFIGNMSTATNGGGGAVSDAGGSITDSLFLNNSANSTGSTGGALNVGNSAVPISGSTFQGNTAWRAGAVTAGTITITNSTFFNNSSTLDGGAIVSSNGNTYNNITVTGNTANGGTFGGGIAFGDSDIIRNSIVAGNTGGSSPDCSIFSFFAPTSQGHNIMGINSCGAVAATGDQFGTAAAPIDPALDALKTNSGKMAGSNVGGQMPMVIDTFALLIGSTALNAGDPGAPGTGGTTCAATDERGVTRPQGSACDIGAFEAVGGTGFTPTADISIMLSAMPNPVVQNTTLTYTATASNAGPDPGSGMSVSLPLPAGVNFSSITSPIGWSCTTPAVGSTGTITCTKPSLNVAPPTALFTIQSTPTAVGNISATATISTTGTDSTAADNASMASVMVNTGPADLSIIKTAAPNPVNAGSNITYTLTVNNAGPNSAPGVTVTDMLPAGLAFVSASASQGSCSQAAGTVTCNLGNMANAASATATIVVTAGASAVPSVSNTASVSSMTTDPNPANDSSTQITTVNPAADLGVTKTAAPNPVNVGANLTYTVTVSNAGPSAAAAVTLTDMLPANAAFVSATPSAGVCPAPAAGTLICNLGTINNSANVTVTIVVTPSAAAAPSISNTASVSSATTDPNTANNSAMQTTTVNPVADLSITKSAAPSPVNVNSNLTYTLTVNNAGPSSAAAVVVTDTLPAGVTFVSATPTVGTCSQAAGTVTCNLASVNNAAMATITIVVTPTAAGTVNNTASVSSTTMDPAPANNSASTSTNVNPVNTPDFTLSVMPTAATITAGKSATFTLTLAPVNGFNQTISLGCSIIATASSCSGLPVSVTLDGIHSATAMLTVDTKMHGLVQRPSPPTPRVPALPIAVWVFVMLLCVLVARKTRQFAAVFAGHNRLPRAALAAAMLLTLVWTGCDHAARITGTPPGTYTVTITGTSGAISHSATVSLMVQ